MSIKLINLRPKGGTFKIKLSLLSYPKGTKRIFIKPRPEKLAAYAEDFKAGRVLPIILHGKSNRVLDGMQRVETAKLLGYTEIDAHRADID